MRKTILSRLTLCLLLSGIFCAQADPGKNSFETLNLTLPARYFGLAGAGVALTDDISSCFINSSRLVLVRKAEITAGGSLHFDDAVAGYAAAAYPMPLGVFAFSFVYFNYGEAELRTGDSLEPDALFTPEDFIAGISFGASLFKFFSYGINLKYIQENLSPEETLFAFAADLNTHFDVRAVTGLQIGLTINNFGVIPSGRFEGNPLPLSFILGLSRPIEFSKPVAGLYDIRPVLDLEFSTEPRFRVLAGTEWCWYHLLPSTHLVLRTGVTWPSDAGWIGLFRLGAGLERKHLSLDYGTGWFPDLGFIHRLSFSWKYEAPPEKRFVRFVSEPRLEETLKEIDDMMKTPFTPRTNIPKQTAPPPPPPRNDDFDFEEE